MPSGEKSTPGGNAGWGGPPKGAGRGGPARHPKKEFKKSGVPNVGVALAPAFDGTMAGPGRGHVSPAGEDRRARDAARSEVAQEKLFSLVTAADRQETQLAAAVALLNRIDGMPIARNLNANVDALSRLSDAELQAERERLGRAMREVREGRVAPDMPDESDGVVH